MNKQQTICRIASRHKPYSQLGNAMLRDHRLSFEARGLLAFILSHPSDWQVHVRQLCHETGLGREKALRIFRELIAHDYCQRNYRRGDDGRMAGVEYVFTDEPSPQSGKPFTAEPDTEIQTAYKEGQSQRNTETKKEEDAHTRDLETDGATGTLSETQHPKPQAESAEGLREGASGERLPFTQAVIDHVRALGVEPEALVARYRTRTRHRRVRDPCAYLLRMARDEAAKRIGVPVEALKGVASRDTSERMAAFTALAAAPPPKVVVSAALRSSALVTGGAR